MKQYKLEVKNDKGKEICSINIKNIPTESEFYRKANFIYFESLLCFFNFLNETQKLNKNNDPNFGIDLLYIEKKFNKSLMITSLKKKIIDIISNLHHACEIYLKSSILKNNPLLLLNKTNYFGCKNNTINFLDETTIDAHRLIEINKNIYGETFFKNSLDCNFQKKFHEYRKIRNKNIHSVSLIDELNISEIKNMFLTTFEIFNKNKKINIELYKYINITEKLNVLLIKSKEGFNINSFFCENDKKDGLDYRRKIYMDSLALLNNHLNKKELSIMFNVNKESQKFICPNCEKEYRFTIENARNRVPDCPNKGCSYMFKSIKSLTIINKKYNKCFLCGIKILNSDIITDYCQCCKEYTIFFKGNKKIGKTCLKCGCINELDFY